MGKRRDISRREALAAMLGLGVAAACEPTTPSRVRVSSDRATATRPTSRGEAIMKEASPDSARMPTIFLPHGGGPWPFIDTSLFGGPEMWSRMSAYMKDLRMTPPASPSAVLVVSAHWEAAVPTVQSSPSPPMLYDYDGFPPEAYEVEWPAPGAPELAARIRDRLDAAGIASGEDGERGFDHGVFVPLKLTYPGAEIPTLQLSLKRGLDPVTHIEIGRALEPLRDEGVLIVGSGMSYHNLGAIRKSMRGGPGSMLEDSRAFDMWLEETVKQDASRMETRLAEWERAPKARLCHPREEHLLPLMVVAGAAGEDTATLPYRDVVMNAHVSAVHFG